jgi:phosphoribosyl-ATP pyrophosphatase (EC 3.6.1.31)|uniref:Phosphoribosyl-ATP pyrophosphatase n=1 Tax=Ignisphaera aggregans TaxID=334771 RepID=A0A7J2TA56_9CREN
MCETLSQLYSIIIDRINRKPQGSYTVQLVEKGKGYIARKVGEEATEVIVASLIESKERLVQEVADLLYHLLVLMAVNNASIDEVCNELRRRMKK